MAIGSRKIFIDSSLFLAFIDRANLNYAKAVRIFELLAHQRYQVYTSSIVILQTFNAIERDLGSTLANDFLRAILESSIQVLYATDSNFLAAFRYLKVNPGHRSSLSNIIIADLMQKHSIGSILTFDFWPNLMGIFISNLITA